MFFTDEFAHRALVTTGEMAGRTVAVQFHDPYSEPFGQAGSSPSCLVQGHEVRDLLVEDEIEIAGKAYRINAIEPDGHGVTNLTLADA